VKREERLSAARRVLWQTWMSSDDEIGSAAAQGLADMGMLVDPGGAAELERLRSLMNAQPVDLSEQQLDALIEAGNHALSDYYHERACACSEYPATCATNPAYRREAGHWDTEAFAIGLGAVLGVWEAIRDASGKDDEDRFEPHPLTGSAPVRPTLSHHFDPEHLGEIDAKRRLPLCRNCRGPATDPAHAGDTRPEVQHLRALLNAKRPASETPAPSRGASEIKHPAIRRTRDHFNENPLPGQRKDGGA
jgi:hypothetical protein